MVSRESGRSGYGHQRAAPILRNHSTAIYGLAHYPPDPVPAAP